jgi:hypothetical protein
MPSPPSAAQGNQLACRHRHSASRAVRHQHRFCRSNRYSSSRPGRTNLRSILPDPQNQRIAVAFKEVARIYCDAPKANSKFWRTGLGGPQPPPGPLLAGADGDRRWGRRLFLPLRVIWINGFRKRSSPRRGTRGRGAAHRTATERPHNPFEGCGSIHGMPKGRFTCSRLTCGALRNTETLSKIESSS